jgi:hypothetical protein
MPRPIDVPNPPAGAAANGAEAIVTAQATAPVAASHPPLPIVVGCPRSGTSLLAVMLDSHPQLAMPPETDFLVPATRLAGEGQSLRQQLFDLVTFAKEGDSTWADCGLDQEVFRRRLDAVEPFTVADGVRAFYALYAEQHGKPRCGDKKPHYVGALPAIGALLPEAHFVHIIRDPRDTVLSWRRTWFAPSQDLAVLARGWLEHVVAGRRGARSVAHYLEVRYENLVLVPERVLRRVCDFIGLPYEPAMLDYERRGEARIASLRERAGADGSVAVSRDQRSRIHANLARPPLAGRVRAWEREMSVDDRRRVEAILGPALQQLGYES